MNYDQQVGIKKLIEMNAQVLSMVLPTGITIVDGVPAFKYNKVTTKLIQDIADMKALILNPPKESDNGSKSK